MDTFRFELLSLIKERFKKVVGNKKYQIQDIGKEFSARQFYLENLEDNLFEPMIPQVLSQYSNGSGNELEGKMKALRSSSAMTYNLLGNDDIMLYGNSRLGAGKYSLQYEWQGHTLKAELKGQPANIVYPTPQGKAAKILSILNDLESPNATISTDFNN